MGGHEEPGSRGQLILVGALVLAVVLVGVALVLNSAIYVENLATRTTQQGTTQIATLQQESVSGTAQAMDHHNHDTASHTSYAELETRLDESVREWSTLQLQNAAREGRFVDADVDTMTRGTRIGQNDGGEFVPQDRDLLNDVIDITEVSSWAVTPKAYQVRDFTMTVERDQISDATLYAEANVETFLAELGGSLSVGASPFTMLYDMNDDGTYEHAVSIYRPDDGDGDSNDVKFTYYNQSTGATATCEIDNAPSTFGVDVSGGTVEGGGGACTDVFDFQQETSDPYQLVFVEGDEIEGDYQLIVDTERGAFESDYEDSDGLLSLVGCALTGLDCNFEDYYEDHTSHGDTYSPSSPYVEPAIYDATITVTYRSDEVRSDATIRVAPNEP